MVKLLALIALLAGGCKASLAGDDTGGSNNPDANGSGNVDAAVQIDAAPACANGRKVFLEFLGVTLTDNAASDATTNKARWLNTTSSVVPPWRQGTATRATEIQEVIDGVKARLSTTPIEVVTVRPTTGPYVMIVLGGDNTGNGGTVGTIYSYSTSYHDCSDTTKSDLGWVSDMTGETTEFVADLVVGSIGWGLGLNGTTDTNGCMCGWTTSCNNATTACTLSASIPSSIGGTTETACPNQNPQNEVAAFSTGFCQ